MFGDDNKKTDSRSISTNEIELLLEVARESLQKYGTLTPPREAMYKVIRAECPHCGHVGFLEQDFGFRVLQNGERRPQSWCRKCRSSPDSHPTRKGKRG